MDLLFFVYTLPNAIHSLTVGLAISLFLALYIILLVAQARKVKAFEPALLPVWPFWLAFMYPSWLDKLTLRSIARAFVQALGIAVISWLVMSVIFLAILAGTYGS